MKLSDIVTLQEKRVVGSKLALQASEIGYRPSVRATESLSPIAAKIMGRLSAPNLDNVPSSNIGPSGWLRATVDKEKHISELNLDPFAVQSGGPGSGRRPSGVSREMHNTLKEHGFSHHGDKEKPVAGAFRYRHSSGAHSVAVSPDPGGDTRTKNDWHYTNDKMHYASGEGAESLDQHLRQNKVK